MSKEITYISKVYISSLKESEQVITVTTQNLSPAGDVINLNTKLLVINPLISTSSLEVLQPEVSDVFPYKVVTPYLPNGHKLILSPSVKVFPTASQNYYMATKFERYNPVVARSLNRQFEQLQS